LGKTVLSREIKLNQRSSLIESAVEIKNAVEIMPFYINNSDYRFIWS